MQVTEKEYEVGKIRWNPGTLRCHLAILREADGSFSAIVLNLPGVGSCGATEEEAIANAREAVAGTVESFREDGVDIPWANDYPVPDGVKTKWICSATLAR